jgi:CRISPR/Cas system CSM-associated protein Csm4 (group 5 of RAMP superfamily)
MANTNKDIIYSTLEELRTGQINTDIALEQILIMLKEFGLAVDGRYGIGLFDNEIEEELNEFLEDSK